MSEKDASSLPYYEDWIKQQGVPVVEGYGVDVASVPLGNWPRKGGRGAFLQLRAWKAPRHGSPRDSLGQGALPRSPLEKSFTRGRARLHEVGSKDK